MESIVQDIKNGNIERFKMVYQQYHAKLYFYVLKCTHSAYLSEETVQLSFILLWERREKLSTSYNISAQLFRIAKSVMTDLLRKQQVRNRHTACMVQEQPDWHMETDITVKEELQQVYNSIEQLSPIRKNVFKLSRFEGLPHKEIARQLSISPKTVENHILRAVRQLKDSLLLVLILLIRHLL
ncbi:RNA polymerase sigma-70 factor (ECF subfamily) [Chitinophaga polysaccharea]|uniref:RNA polymerase sigma-70 factor (ECF subfamily) n=1 Tax=Chitinophaga polysaccharea TaxID=1293035 RepID=A0A561P6V3_9BACT|nr:RNA polymerase sigma-70 factor [Chitinophaga polysaccharea]TWF33847.1 RNA polymerase sigma-70 factor (ECF subfamily) [Chitinophaga polysaccharea]